MAEFTLPKNSKVKQGKTFAAANGATRKKTFRIYRWEPDSGKTPELIPMKSISISLVRWCLMRSSILKTKSIRP